ncbi:MAG: hypothetical protein WC055_08375 [Melioribacteraceae bacterium]
MKIVPNQAGTYSLNNIRNTAQAKEKFSLTSPEISGEEKKYFAEVYPQKQNEIMDYEFYNARGKTTGVSVGSLLDRRG